LGLGTPARFSTGASREASVDNVCFSIWLLDLGVLRFHNLQSQKNIVWGPRAGFIYIYIYIAREHEPPVVDLLGFDRQSLAAFGLCGFLAKLCVPAHCPIE
jgi:hypothetical protein